MMTNVIKVGAFAAAALLVGGMPGWAEEAAKDEVAARHLRVARQAASESLVLLENDGLLPLKPGTKVALFGAWRDYRTGGCGSSQVLATRTVGFREGLEAAGFVVDPTSRDVAIYVVYRAGGENWDIPRESYRLSDEELKEMFDVTTSGFKKIVVIVNGGLLPDLGPWMDTRVANAALFTWYPGQEGCAAIGDVLAGKVNPSGRLATTSAKEISDYASDATFLESPEYVPYEDDIFVGYRYFETVPGAAAKVRYPFGHGLGYSTFEIAPDKPVVSNGQVTVTASVRNAGKVAGRTSVLAYTSQRGGRAEHPTIELRAFGKTRLLKPGESERLTLSFARDDLAAFDDEGWSGRVGSWVLDAGEYRVLVGGSVRDVREAGGFAVAEPVILSTPGIKCNPAALARRMRASGRPTDCAVTYLGRKGIDWKSAYDYPTEGVAKWKLADVAAGRVTMDAFLDQMTLAEMVTLIHGHPAVVSGGTGSIGLLEKYGMPGAQTCDGPCGVRRAMPATAFPCAALMACAFDRELMREMGRVIGEEANEVGFDVLLAPGLCIHRHPLCGRNFEYFSEDPLVSGVNAAAFVEGVQSTGVGATVKHFACNDRETNRRVTSSVVSERALREIYLRGFERAVREARPWAVMTAYSGINGIHSTANHGLIEGILRGEWGFDGVTMSDWYTVMPMWREMNGGNDVKMNNDLVWFTDRKVWRTGIGERQACAAYVAENSSYSYLYRDSLRSSARRICELVMKSHRFRAQISEGERTVGTPKKIMSK